MTFRRNVRLNPRQVTDRRGGRGFGGGLGGGFGGGFGGGRRRGGMALGGGLGGIILLVAIVLLSGGLGDLAGGLGAAPGGQAASSDLAQECQTGADANERVDCRVVGAVNSLDAYWSEAFQGSDRQYRTPETVLFEGQVDTGCGGATSAVGPFYCPLDQTIYIDLGFYEDLESRFGAEGGPFAEMYVIAHEYGHHVQNLLGLLEAGRDAGAEGGAVRTELQADCFAGVWAGNAVETGYLEPLTGDQISQALDAASAIGDDRIQEQAQGQVNPETWTHGSAEQRQQWFTTGLESRSAPACDTFDADL